LQLNHIKPSFTGFALGEIRLMFPDLPTNFLLAQTSLAPSLRKEIQECFISSGVFAAVQGFPRTTAL
jgi:hypothetical protein